MSNVCCWDCFLSNCDSRKLSCWFIRSFSSDIGICSIWLPTAVFSFSLICLIYASYLFSCTLRVSICNSCWSILFCLSTVWSVNCLRSLLSCCSSLLRDSNLYVSLPPSWRCLFYWWNWRSWNFSWLKSICLNSFLQICVRHSSTFLSDLLSGCSGLITVTLNVGRDLVSSGKVCYGRYLPYLLLKLILSLFSSAASCWMLSQIYMKHLSNVYLRSTSSTPF